MHQPGSPFDDAVGALQFATWDRQEEQPDRALLTSTKVVALLTPALFFWTASVSLVLLWLEQREAVGRSKAQGTGSSQGRLPLQQPDAAGTRDKALGTWGPRGPLSPGHPGPLLTQRTYYPLGVTGPAPDLPPLLPAFCSAGGERFAIL